MTWGRGLSGALGHGNESSWNLPNPVKSLQGIKISSAAAGWNHTAFVTGLLGPNSLKTMYIILNSGVQLDGIMSLLQV